MTNWRIINWEDEDNEETDDPDFWEQADDYDCLNCGMCKWCIQRSESFAKELNDAEAWAERLAGADLRTERDA